LYFISGHLEVREKLKELRKATLPSVVEKIQKEQDEKNDYLLEVTSRMFRTVFMEIKRNIPFSSHQEMVALQEKNGVNMGFHHYEATSAARMSLFIVIKCTKLLYRA
jgi:hypothetical protein